MISIIVSRTQQTNHHDGDEPSFECLQDDNIHKIFVLLNLVGGIPEHQQLYMKRYTTDNYNYNINTIIPQKSQKLYEENK